MLQKYTITYMNSDRELMACTITEPTACTITSGLIPLLGIRVIKIILCNLNRVKIIKMTQNV